MAKLMKYVDYGLIVLIAVFSAFGLQRHFVDGLVLTLNFYIGLALLFVAFLYKLFAFPGSEYCVILILFLATFSIINFSPEVFNGKIDYIEIAYNTLGFNPISFLIVIVYFIVNRRVILKGFKRSDEEIKNDEDKMVAFYYKRFKELNEFEFKEVVDKISSYSEDAQIAIIKITKEKSV